jgi:NOL1/NOP2/fmu family ribosome biogenesis protein
MPKGKKNIPAALNAFTNDTLNISFDERRIIMNGSYIYQIPETTINLNGIRVIHPGWWLGSIRKNIFWPSHALAMGLRSQEAKNILPLDVEDNQLSAYLRGESFPNAREDGRILITVAGYPIGWGKRTKNIVKNHYPRGLRQYS